MLLLTNEASSVDGVVLYCMQTNPLALVAAGATHDPEQRVFHVIDLRAQAQSFFFHSFYHTQSSVYQFCSFVCPAFNYPSFSQAGGQHGGCVSAGSSLCSDFFQVNRATYWVLAL